MHPSLVLCNNGKQALKSGAKRDPELYVLLGLMTAAFGGVGYYFGRNPTSSTSDEARGTTHIVTPGWGSLEDKGSSAPSALHAVTVPNVNLPKELHERFNKYGKDGF